MGTSRDNDIRAMTSLPNLQSEKGRRELHLLGDQNSEHGDSCPVLLHLPWDPGTCAVQPFVSWEQVSLNTVETSAMRLPCLKYVPAGPVDSGVIQIPRQLTKARGQQATLSCSPSSEHDTVSWYKQALGQGPQFLVQYYNEEERQKGDIPGRFLGRQFPDRSSELNVSILELTDSALTCHMSTGQLQKCKR
ncbi:hypothetical protein HPG69_016424 [Diceros bicornis minor]|uniref:Ig-like domain-containing protein n=1 Tax=Diceros bicornis minor TaxID=77932 RepID=A0A7J7EFK3_DICBM|nr:hypothetical protein HPG69_016424 [Diceros bicornis minor]